MPDQETDQPVDQTISETQPETQTQDILPDEIKPQEDPKLAELKQSYEKEKQSLEEKYRLAEQEKSDLVKRLKDNQEYISRTRNIEKEKTDVDLPRKTLEDYLGEIESKIIDKDFEEDPKKGLKNLARKIVSDIAYDRDLERQEYHKAILEVENRAFKRVLSLDPEKSKIVQDVERLNQERPDLVNLTFEQKVEWINKDSTFKKQSEMQNRVNRDKELASDAGGGRTNNHKAERLPEWASDREVQQKADGIFVSKKEMVDWSNSAKAREMAKQKRPKYLNG